MRVAVVYESFFGATRTVAEAVAAGIRAADPSASVRVYPASSAPSDLQGLDMLVTGGPTHLLGLSSRASRWLQAQYWGDPVSQRRARRPHGRPGGGRALRDWLRLLHPSPELHVAVFDTRVAGHLAGHASGAVARLLRRQGIVLASPAQSFLVAGVTGPLAPGEERRVAAWGASLVRCASTRGGASARPIRGAD